MSQTTSPGTTNAATLSPFNLAQQEIDTYFTNNPQDKARDILNSLNPDIISQPNDKYNLSVNKSDREIFTEDVYQRDINTALEQQNALYIIGTITCATLLISAILLAR